MSKGFHYLHNTHRDTVAAAVLTSELVLDDLLPLRVCWRVLSPVIMAVVIMSSHSLRSASLLAWNLRGGEEEGWEGRERW